MRRGLTLLELVMVVSILAVLTAMIVPGMNAQNEETRVAVAKKSLQDLRDTIANRYLVDMQDLPRANAADTVRGGVNALPQLHFLFNNPRQYLSTANPPYSAVNDYDASTRIGWNGPYVMTTPGKYPVVTDRRFPKDPNDTRTWAACGFTTDYGFVNDQTLNDPWGSPYVITFQTRAFGTGNSEVREYLVSAGPNRVLDVSTWVINTDGSLNSGDDLALLIRSRNVTTP
jgi:prepilin-type N-terminal cleavage/methylation domain-containing protein